MQWLPYGSERRRGSTRRNRVGIRTLEDSHCRRTLENNFGPKQEAWVEDPFGREFCEKKCDGILWHAGNRYRIPNLGE